MNTSDIVTHLRDIAAETASFELHLALTDAANEIDLLRANNRGICKLADERVAEIHRLRQENARLRKECDPDVVYVAGVADGANLLAVPAQVSHDLAESFGVPVC